MLHATDTYETQTAISPFTVHLVDFLVADLEAILGLKLHCRVDLSRGHREQRLAPPSSLQGRIETMKHEVAPAQVQVAVQCVPDAYSDKIGTLSIEKIILDFVPHIIFQMLLKAFGFANIMLTVLCHSCL